MHPSYASNTASRLIRSGNTHPYPPSVAPEQQLSGVVPHPSASELRSDVRTDLRAGAGPAPRHNLRRNTDTMLGARLVPRRPVATSRELGTADMSGTSDMSATSGTRDNPRRPHHYAGHTFPTHLARVDTAPRLRERLLSHPNSTSLRPSHARRGAPAAPITESRTDISSPQRYRALSERCAMMIVADQARQHQYSAPALAAALSHLARTLQNDTPHAQRLGTLRDFRAHHSATSHTLEQQRAIARSLMDEYLAARYISDPVTTADTLAVEIGERRTALEHQLRMSPVYISLQTLQHCLDLHGHVQQLREKCAVAFLHAYVARQNTPSTGSLAVMCYAAMHEEILQYQGFVFARDAIAGATPRSLATVKMMGETDAPLHLGARAANMPQAQPLQEPPRLHAESNVPSRPQHFLSHKLTGQIFKMYARRTGRVMLANRMGDPTSPLETRLTYLQGFLANVVPEAGQGVPTLIRIYAGLRYFSDPLCTPRVIALELGCEESVAQASLDNMHEFRQLRDLSGFWNAPEDRLMLRERCAQSMLNAACDAQTSNERIHPDGPGSAYTAETTTLYRALNNVLCGELSFRDRQRQVIDHSVGHLAQRR